jgi:DNA-binding NtrC family response regulator
LNVIPIHLPPLRDRKTDIPLMIEHFLRDAAEHYGRKPLTVSHQALSLMLDYRWPGNVRELQNAMQFALVKCEGNVIAIEHLPLELRDAADVCARRGPARKLDLEAVRIALARTGGNKAKAAKLMGVGRATLYRFLNDHPDLG